MKDLASPASALPDASPEQALRALLESMDDHMVIYDAQWRYAFVTDKGAAMVGKKREELIGRSIWDVFPEAVGNLYHQRLHEAAAQQRVVRFEHYYPPFDRWFDNHVYPTAAGVAVFCVDITEFKADERALRVSEERYRSLVEASGAIVYACDPEARWYLRNESWEAFTGQTFEEYQGYGWSSAVHPDDRERVQASVARAIATKTTWHEEGRLWHAPTRTYRHQEARSVPILNADGSIREWIGTCLDIHARRSAEDAVREADRRKDEFLAVLAHELRNPLAPIVSSVQILRLPQAELARNGALEVLERQVHHLVRLVDDLMEVARITRGTIELRRETLTIDAPIRAAIEISRPAIEGRDHRLEVAPMPDGLAIHGDRVRLTQVFANLLTNAAKYTSRGGTIQLAAERSGGEVLVRVTDNGAGIAPEDQARVFEMFARAGDAADRMAGGLGIGLSLARRLAQLHGGDVTLSSAGRGKGSTFVVGLPIAGVTEAAVASQQPRPPTSSQRVLVVDDNRDAANTLAALLAAMGQDVHCTHDGNEALRMAARLRPDVVLLDLGMPPPDGLEVARQIRAMPGLGHVKLVAVTGWGQPSDRERTQASGFDLHLVKPLGIDEVRKALGVVERPTSS